ncbi:MAG: hypothetical protein KY450_14545 [Actinobacteria bacterium]|nr:hypothetical protein [Actinomycetota bacterium]
MRRPARHQGVHRVVVGRAGEHHVALAQVHQRQRLGLGRHHLAQAEAPRHPHRRRRRHEAAVVGGPRAAGGHRFQHHPELRRQPSVEHVDAQGTHRSHPHVSGVGPGGGDQAPDPLALAVGAVAPGGDQGLGLGLAPAVLYEELLHPVPRRRGRFEPPPGGQLGPLQGVDHPGLGQVVGLAHPAQAPHQQVLLLGSDG